MNIDNQNGEISTTTSFEVNGEINPTIINNINYEYNQYIDHKLIKLANINGIDIDKSETTINKAITLWKHNISTNGLLFSETYELKFRHTPNVVIYDLFNSHDDAIIYLLRIATYKKVTEQFWIKIWSKIIDTPVIEPINLKTGMIEKYQLIYLYLLLNDYNKQLVPFESIVKDFNDNNSRLITGLVGPTGVCGPTGVTGPAIFY